MTTKIEWFNTSESLPKDNRPVIGDNAVKINEWRYYADDTDGPKWFPSYTYKTVPDPIRWAYIPEWPDSMVPTEPGWYTVWKDGAQVDMMWIPDQEGHTARYFGSRFMVEKKPWFDFASHTFKKVEELVI